LIGIDLDQWPRFPAAALSASGSKGLSHPEQYRGYRIAGSAKALRQIRNSASRILNKDPQRIAVKLLELWDNCKFRGSDPPSLTSSEPPAIMNTQTDIERARFNMVEQQIRPWEVLDQQVLDLLFVLRREDFVLPQYRNLAFFDMEIPLAADAGEDERMLAPKLEARMLQAVSVKPTDRVLEIGTGSGYMTALLARRAAHVTSVEINGAYSAEAAQRLTAHDIRNVTLEVGDGARGWARNAPYDVIVLTGSTPVLDPAFQASLNSGGRLLAIVGEAPVMTAQLINCEAPGVFRTTGLFETCVPSLRNAPQPKRFVF
jgi:protein-L-isoaspartate(D-aspartate) O-methyltransferase